MLLYVGFVLYIGKCVCKGCMLEMKFKVVNELCLLFG